MIPQTFKDSVARKYGYKDWADLGSDFTSPSAPWYKITQYLEESALLYCKSKWNEACEQQRQACSDYMDEISSGVIGRVNHFETVPQPEFKP